MERYLVWFALLVGFGCWLWGMLPGRGGAAASGGSRPDDRRFLLLAGLLPPLVLLLTLPGSGFFTPGAGWGTGFFIGGIAALLTAYALLRHVSENETRQGAVRTAVTAAGLPLVSAALPLLFLRASLIDSLLGVAIGWFSVAILVYAGVGTLGKTAQALIAGTVFAAILCAVSVLGIYRDPQTQELARGSWSAVALAVGGLVPVALLLAATPAAKIRMAGLEAPVWIGFAAIDLLAWLVGTRAVGEIRLVPVVAVGLLAGPLTLVILRDAMLRTEEASGVRALNAPSLLGLPPLAVLLLTAAFMVAFQLLQGFGVGLLLVTLWATGGALIARPLPDTATAPASDAVSSETRAFLSLLIVGVVLALYRVFATRFAPELRGVSLTDHYALFGLIAGAMLPTVLSALLPVPPQPATEPGGPGRGYRSVGVGYLVLVGILALAAPAVIVILWGAKCAIALLFGLALGAAFGFGAHPGETPGRSLLPGLMALAMSLAVTQWTGRLLPLADLTRDERVRILLVIGAVLLVLVGVVEFLRRGARPEAVAAEGAQR